MTDLRSELVDNSAIDQIARSLFRADCENAGQEVNWGRSSEQQPRGFKTEVMRWHNLARAALTAMRVPNDTVCAAGGRALPPEWLDKTSSPSADAYRVYEAMINAIGE